MLVRVSLLLLVSLAASTEALSEDLCQKACTVSDSLCWFCSLFFDNSTSSLESDSNPRAPTVPELVEKAKVLFRQQKIVGGRALEYGDAPWTASIKYRDGRSFFTYCGGTLISDRFVLTAAHCLMYQDAEDLFVGIGDHDRNQEDEAEILSAVVRIIVHPDFKSTTYEADVGLLELAQTIRFDKYKQPAALVRPDVALTGMAFNVTGWGVVQEKGHYAQKLLQTEVPYVAFDKCRDAYHSLSIAPKIRPGMICAGFAKGEYDACQGDSGGPLVTTMAVTDLDNVILTQAASEEVSEVEQVQPRYLWPRLSSLLDDEKTMEQVQGYLNEAASLQSVLLSQIIQQQATNILNGVLHNPQIIQLSRSQLEPSIPTVVGVVSWGMGCGRPRYVGVYTDVRVYRAWILDKMGGEPNHIWKF